MFRGFVGLVIYIHVIPLLIINKKMIIFSNMVSEIMKSLE